MRRVVVSTNQEGRSCVASDEEIADTGLFWTVDPMRAQTLIDAVGPERVYAPAQPPAGGARCVLGEFPPGKGMQLLPEPLPGMDERGFHVTRTIDVVYMLAGSATLDLDDDSVELSAGDVAVLQAPNHAWRNPRDKVARFIDIMISTDHP
jgi:mannose-6-phosphate isomerase-like protein (cupin superfamily)